MKHHMKLFEAPFTSIKTGRKTIEVRLNDLKRREIKVGDKIEFTKLPEMDESILVEVTDLQVYPTFQAMYEDIPSEAFDTEDMSILEMIESTYEIYTPAQEKKYKTLAIQIKLLE